VARQELSAMTDEEDKQAEAALEALLSNMAMDEE
jgi:hypothetical protein